MSPELRKAIEDKAKSFNGGITNAVFAGAEACFEIMQAEIERLRTALSDLVSEISEPEFKCEKYETRQITSGAVETARAALKDPGGV